MGFALYSELAVSLNLHIDENMWKYSRILISVCPTKVVVWDLLLIWNQQMWAWNQDYHGISGEHEHYVLWHGKGFLLDVICCIYVTH